MLRSLPLALCLLAAPALAASDPDDAEGLMDHAAIPRFPGYWLSSGDVTDFNAHDFTVDYGSGKTRAMEGRYWSFRYVLKEDAKRPSPLALFRNYEAAFKKHGGTTVAKQVDEGYVAATFKMPFEKSERWVELKVHDNSNNYELFIVEPAPMKQELELSASEMLQHLERTGFVALYGITFDTGKDVIKPESEMLLQEIVQLLKQNAGLKLSIEGHTDNVGNKASNVALSQKRADAVTRWLVAKGIAEKRLKAAGHGDGIPVADNRIEVGRAKNRRVELVKTK